MHPNAGGEPGHDEEYTNAPAPDPDHLVVEPLIRRLRGFRPRRPRLLAAWNHEIEVEPVRRAHKENPVRGRSRRHPLNTVAETDDDLKPIYVPHMQPTVAKNLRHGLLHAVKTGLQTAVYGSQATEAEKALLYYLRTEALYQARNVKLLNLLKVKAISWLKKYSMVELSTKDQYEIIARTTAAAVMITTEEMHAIRLLSTPYEAANRAKHDAFMKGKLASRGLLRSAVRFADAT